MAHFAQRSFSLTIPVHYEGGEKESSEEVNRYPDICPFCEQGSQPIFCYAYGKHHSMDRTNILQVIFKCPRERCNKLFIAFYKQDLRLPGSGLYLQNVYQLAQSVNFKVFPEEVTNISPMFPVIYNQALIADENGLKEICGPGYRRALEFLVKDYLIKVKPDQEEEIKKEFLGKSIKRIDDKKIKQTSERAVWLANDESHYVRKWEDKDVKDLKLIIKLIVNWIDSTILTEEIIEDMPAKGKKE